jgi:hypothetical protein
MWMTKRKLKEEVVRLNYRIADLEERLCPCESHDWKHVGYYFTSSAGGFDFDTVHKYKCRRCGKMKESMC